MIDARSLLLKTGEVIGSSVGWWMGVVVMVGQGEGGSGGWCRRWLAEEGSCMKVVAVVCESEGGSGGV